MDNQILKATIDVFCECQVKSFPIDCLNILEHYKYRVYTYRELKDKNNELYKMCIEYSEDAFREGSLRIIAYNDKKPHGRIRFSLMHELGHHILGHQGSSQKNEREANIFASYILAPRMAIHYAKCKNANDVSHAFGLSHEAAENAFDDYRRWYRHTVMYKMTEYDKAMYLQFYNKERKCFVWSIKECDFCGKTLYNSIEDRCKICTLPKRYKERHTLNSYSSWNDDNDRILHDLHLKWLYDF